MSFRGYGERALSIAMLGMVEGNGHPYSWSAIFNGYDPEVMGECPYAAIPDYLGKQPRHTIGLSGAKITHIWTDNPKDAQHVARASLIPHVVEHPTDVIGEVDAVIIATDIGSEHVERCRPFVEAGVPVFIDKPLVDREEDLRTFQAWSREGKPFMSSSCMAYAKEYQPYRASTHDLGEIRYATVTTMKSWERYGIHALSAIYPILGPGFLSARYMGTRERSVVHFDHACGAHVTVAAIDDMRGGFGKLLLCGTHDSAFAAFHDTYYAFRAQLEDFVHFLRTGDARTPFAHTEELMRMIIAGLQSREQNGKPVQLGDIAT